MRTLVRGRVTGIHRLRIGTDGPGVRTLVTLSGYPIMDPICRQAGQTRWKFWTVPALYEAIRQDSLYFEYSGGGVTFAGEEPLTQTEFLHTFIACARERKDPWTFALRTTLRVPGSALVSVLDDLDLWLVDIRSGIPGDGRTDPDPETARALDNLALLRGRNVRLRIFPSLAAGPSAGECLERVLDMGFSLEQLEFPASTAPLCGDAG